MGFNLNGLFSLNQRQLAISGYKSSASHRVHILCVSIESLTRYLVQFSVLAVFGMKHNTMSCFHNSVCWRRYVCVELSCSQLIGKTPEGWTIKLLLNWVGRGRIIWISGSKPKWKIYIYIYIYLYKQQTHIYLYINIYVYVYKIQTSNMYIQMYRYML